MLKIALFVLSSILVKEICCGLDKRNLLQFGNIITAVTGRHWSDYNGYGCFCGYGGGGNPLDELDSCCEIHDKCYGQVLEDNKIFCSPYLVKYKFDGLRIGRIRCSKKNNRCQRQTCECDRKAANCFKKSQYNKKNKGINKSRKC